MKSLRAQFDYFLFDAWQLSPEIAGMIRIGYALFLFLFFIEYSPYLECAWMGTYPSEFYRPFLSLYAVYPGFLPSFWFVGVNLLVFLFNILLSVGWRTQFASLGLGVSLMLMFSGFAEFSNLPQTGFLFIFPCLMAFSGWGNAFSRDGARGDQRPMRSWPLAFIALFIALMFLFSALTKIMGGWLDPNVPSAYYWILQVEETWELNAILGGWAKDVVLPLWILEILDWLIVGFECSFCIVLIFPRWFRFWISFSIPFHLSILLLMGIDFSFHLIGYLIFLDWKNVHPRIRKRIERFTSWLERLFPKVKNWHLGVLLIFNIILLYWKPVPSEWIHLNWGIKVSDLFGLAIQLPAFFLMVNYWRRNLQLRIKGKSG